jgi:hypothetical protein
MKSAQIHPLKNAKSLQDDPSGAGVAQIRVPRWSAFFLHSTRGPVNPCLVGM